MGAGDAGSVLGLIDTPNPSFPWWNCLVQQNQQLGMGRHRRTSFWTFRWVMVAIGAAIAAVLLLRGDYLLGGLIGALATVRLVYMLVFFGRRRAFRSSYGAGPLGGDLRGLARSEFMVAAGVVGLDPAQVRRAFDQGRSLAELATGAGVPLERLVNAIVSDASAKIDQGVAGGRLTQERAREDKARLPVWASRLVKFHKGDLRRTGGWM